MIKAKKKRIDWVDAAKGVSICGTVIAHTLPITSLIRTVIYSFHMPLFFILSGFTTTPPTDRQTFFKKLKKDAIRLLIPVIIFSIINYAYFFFLANSFTFDSFLLQLKNMAKSLLWCSGIAVNGAPMLGPLWFLVSLFTAKTIFNFHNIIFKNDKHKILLIALGIIGIFIGRSGHPLLFNFDVSLASLLFITIGYLVKVNFATIKKYYLPILATSIVIWLQAIYSGVFIEIALRDYGSTILVFLEALSGTLIVCSVIKALCESKILRNIMVFFGANSMVILCLHSVDAIFTNLWLHSNVYLSCAIRLSILLALSSVYIISKNLIIKRRARVA